MLKLENSIRGLSFSRVAFDLTIQDTKKGTFFEVPSYQIYVKEEAIKLITILKYMLTS